jgi:hypothetical protein
MMGTRERRMIRHLVLDAQAAEPAISQVDPDLAAEQPLRPDGENVADDEHPKHQHRVNRRAADQRERASSAWIDRGRRRSHAPGDRPVQPRQGETRRKAAPARASAAPSLLVSKADHVRATESPFVETSNDFYNKICQDPTKRGTNKERTTVADVATPSELTALILIGTRHAPSQPPTAHERPGASSALSRVIWHHFPSWRNQCPLNDRRV